MQYPLSSQMGMIAPQRLTCGESQASEDAEGCCSSILAEASQTATASATKTPVPCGKNGLRCTLACGQCKGITCSNVGVKSEEILDD